jgi:hypothetical protein
MDQFIAAQMQLLQGLTASVQQIQQNQQNQQYQQQQQHTPQARDKHRDFMSHHPPAFSHAVDPLDADGWCWGPSASEGPQKHDLTMFSK